MVPLDPTKPCERLKDRLMVLWESCGDATLLRLAEGRPAREDQEPLTDQERADWVSTALMSCYKDTGEPRVFALLFELNEASFAQAIQYKLRRTASGVDARDVLQEVFLNIYRYPHRFVAEKADSFRNWGHRIVRNTLLKFLKNESRRMRFATIDEDIGQRPDPLVRSPYRCAEEAETAEAADLAYVLYLDLYMIHFEQLSAKERHALTMVEVDGLSYKAAAAELGIRLENLKMVIFRGRRKIFRGMGQTLNHLEHLGSLQTASAIAANTPPEPAHLQRAVPARASASCPPR
jgi:RNA polymerase sigma factor (sigma-70 family)